MALEGVSGHEAEDAAEEDEDGEAGAVVCERLGDLLDGERGVCVDLAIALGADAAGGVEELLRGVELGEQAVDHVTSPLRPRGGGCGSRRWRSSAGSG